jgi:hypothetical protein
MLLLKPGFSHMQGMLLTINLKGLRQKDFSQQIKVILE